MEFKRRTLKFNVYGESVEMRFPTVKQSDDYAKRVREAEEQESTVLLLAFLEGLGLQRRISEEMEAEHLAQLCEALMPAKKK